MTPKKLFKYKLSVPSTLNASEGDGDGNGDAGGTEGNTTSEKPFSQDQMRMLNHVVHGAVNKSVGRINAGQDANNERITGEFNELKGLIAGMAKPTENPPSGDPVKDFKDSDEYKALIQRDKDRETEHLAYKAEREKEVQASKRAEEKSAIESALRTAGVPELQLRSATALILSDGVVQRDDNNSVIYQFDRGEYKEPLSVSDGITEFLGTDEGKTFLPATGATGTGVVGNVGGNAGETTKSGSNMTKTEAAAVLTQSFFS